MRRHDKDKLRMIDQQEQAGTITEAEAEELKAVQIRRVFGGARLIK